MKYEIVSMSIWGNNGNEEKKAYAFVLLDITSDFPLSGHTKIVWKVFGENAKLFLHKYGTGEDMEVPKELANIPNYPGFRLERIQLGKDGEKFRLDKGETEVRGRYNKRMLVRKTGDYDVTHAWVAYIARIDDQEVPGWTRDERISFTRAAYVRSESNYEDSPLTDIDLFARLKKAAEATEEAAKSSKLPQQQSTSKQHCYINRMFAVHLVNGAIPRVGIALGCS